MSIRLSALAHMIKNLSAEELAEFRCWFGRFDTASDGGLREPGTSSPSRPASMPGTGADGNLAGGVSGDY